MRGLLAASLLLLAPLAVRAQDAAEEPSAAPFFKAGAKGTTGTAGYKGRNAYLQLGRDLTAKFSYTDYRFDGSTGTTRTIGLHLGWQGESFTAGANASVVPLNDNYYNRAWGLDGAWIISLAGDDEDASGLEELELGAWWAQTRHHQLVPGNPILPGRDIIINQHDIGLTAALTGWDFTLSVDGAKSHYDQDFSILPRAALLRPRLGEALALVNGFPDATGSARLDYSGWSAFMPYVSFASTRYKLQPQPASSTGGLGATFRYGPASLDLGWELVRVKGSDDSKYLTFGGAYRF